MDVEQLGAALADQQEGEVGHVSSETRSSSSSSVGSAQWQVVDGDHEWLGRRQLLQHPSYRPAGLLAQPGTRPVP